LSKLTVSEIAKKLEAAGITDKKEQAGIIAQMKAESNLTPQSESLNYSANALHGKFKKYFPTLADAKKLGRTTSQKSKQKEIANKVYGNRMGNTAPDDGWKYRGRGLIQITGKKNYKHYGDKIGVDLVSNPDLANDPDNAVKIALEFLKENSNNLKSTYDNTNAVKPANWKSKVEEREKYQNEIFKELGGTEDEYTQAPADAPTPGKKPVPGASFFENALMTEPTAYGKPEDAPEPETKTPTVYV